MHHDARVKNFPIILFIVWLYLKQNAYNQYTTCCTECYTDLQKTEKKIKKMRIHGNMTEMQYTVTMEILEKSSFSLPPTRVL